jgi:hypothetical protein
MLASVFTLAAEAGRIAADSVPVAGAEISATRRGGGRGSQPLRPVKGPSEPDLRPDF